MKWISAVSLILLFATPIPAFAKPLKHFCKNQDIVGRSVYACNASVAVLNQSQKLESIDLFNSSAKLRKNCKSGCENDVCELGDKSCLKRCSTDCEKSYISKMSKELMKGIKEYDAECGKSRNAAKCEQNEAKPFCDYTLYNTAKKVAKPKNFSEFKSLQKLHKRVVKSHAKRTANLTREIAKTSERIRSAINERLGCEHLPEGYSVCSSGIETAVPEINIGEFIAVLSLDIEQNQPGVCGQGCVVDSCTAGRNDDAYVGLQNGGTCFCDQFCCQQGDCCDNFVAVCSGSFNTGQCAPISAAKSKLMSVDISESRRAPRDRSTGL